MSEPIESKTILLEAYRRAVKVSAMHPEQMRLMAGEMSAQEIRTVKAFVNYILHGNNTMTCWEPKADG